MTNSISRTLSYLISFTACALMAITSGCASGGFKLTRQYAGFVNKQILIIRIVLYILTGVVFAVTLLVDAVIFNTMDFWEGRVSQGTYEFTKDGKEFHVKHEVIQGDFKRSTIQVFEKSKVLAQTVVLQETPGGEVEMFVDGKLRSRVSDISSFPVASIFDSNGRLVKEDFVLFAMPLEGARIFAVR